MRQFDVIIIGAGGAGLFCAAEAGLRGRKVLVLDHSKKIGGKILISGGGRCNFTNTGTSFKNYFSNNPHFAKSALARFTQSDFIDRVETHGISYHEKKLGQLFCDHSAQEIVDLLESQCKIARVEILMETKIIALQKLSTHDNKFHVSTQNEEFNCESLVIATGGLSLPKLGATDFGYKVARQFGLRVTPLHPALDGFVFSENEASFFCGLAGVSADVHLEVGENSYRENILFTHAGISGPAALQGSLYWSMGESIKIDFFPGLDLEHIFLRTKGENPKKTIKGVISEVISSRLAEKLCEYFDVKPQSVCGNLSDKSLKDLSNLLKNFEFTPLRTVGYSKAEVTKGGVDTRDLSSQTMESVNVKGLFFIGEVVDVTGWLGGYNFQWAWSSGWAAGQIV